MFSSVLQRILERIAAQPVAPALSEGGRTVSYGELGQRIDRWAASLRATGVRSNDFVAVALPRSIEAIVGILATLRAGSAYLPLDPSAPATRNQRFISDSGAGFVLNTDHDTSGLLARRRLTVSELDQTASSLITEFHVAPSDVCYVCYTSGSTGQPRGVLVPHESIAWYLDMMPRTFDRRASDRYALTLPLTLATAVRQTLVPLSLGAHVSIASAEQATDVRALLRFLKAERITVWDVAPSGLRACTDYLRNVTPTARREALDTSLRQIGCIGEPLPASLLREWHELGGPNVFTNSYGQTESTGLTSLFVNEATVPSAGVIPAGRPTPGTTISIVRPDMSPVAVGEEGEIVAEGPSVALGYLDGDPDHRFLGALPGGHRRFRTGDVGRLSPDGMLEVIGRLDDRLKIRGVRVDPFEIEAALREHSHVREAAVAVHSRDGAGVLVAYICYQDAGATGSELRRLLRKRLTEAMIPAVFVPVTELPRTASGKLDRRALPDPFVVKRTEATDQKQKRPPIESAIVRLQHIWSEILDLMLISPEQNFFELGGSSLMAAEVLDHIDQQFDVRLSIGAFYAQPTIEGLALALQGATPAPLAPILVSVRDRGDDLPLFCVHGITGGIGVFYNLAQHLEVDRPVHAFDAQLAHVDALRSVEAIGNQYAAAIRARCRGPYCIAGYSAGGIIAFETARALRNAAEEVAMLCLLDAMAPQSTAWSLMHVHAAAEELAARQAARIRRIVNNPLGPFRGGSRRYRAPVELALETAVQTYIAKPLDVRAVFVQSARLPVFKGRVRVWQSLLPAFSTHRVKAEHSDLLSEPHVRDVAAILESELARV